ncbi:hypothetical protein [Actinomadura sp. 3N407]|uniref:hypothetical protein n=1 Tax=Actinomadura sp. 3N407 TaxID=3457423 RepID=UPI003FCDA668
MDATEPGRALGQLKAELHGRGWSARLDERVLAVSNPNVPALNDTVTFTEGEFRYTWGPAIGTIADVPGVADRIERQLRTVQQQGTQ